jgi:hypothetical protein
MSVDIVQSLRQHLAVCEELLALVMREKKVWQDPDAPPSIELYQTKKNLLPRLQNSLDAIRSARAAWQSMTPQERSQIPEAGPLLQQTQNLILRIIVLDRENEQALLRRGFGPTTQRVGAARPQQPPHFVSELYRRNRF